MTEPSYTVRYSTRKTLRITVERDRSVVVAAPLGTPEETVAREVRKRWGQVERLMAHPQKYPVPRPTKEFVSGESLLFLGRSYPLQLLDEDPGEVRFTDKFYCGRFPQEQVQALFRTWYVAQARQFLPNRIEHFARRLGVSFQRIEVAEFRYRWGSCTPNDALRFNWRLIKAPFSVIDYLIVHELAHLLEPNHTPAFWRIVSVQLPHFERDKEWLKVHGHVLEIDF